MPILKTKLSGFVAWADRRNFISVRSIVLFITVWMTWRVTEWAFLLTNAWMVSGKSGFEAAAVVGSVTAPFAALQTFAFKSYLSTK